MVPVQDGEKRFVAKRIKFQQLVQIIPKGEHAWAVAANFSEVKSLLLEYGFLKLCSLLKIGPQVSTDIGFDLICYRNCVEFFMERCEPSSYRPEGFSRERLALRLKECLGLMHRYHLCHKDIKPQNVLFSPSLQDYVFCDFGIAMTVFEQPGYLTQTVCEGTNNFMSPRMQSLKDGEGLVDLYHNDAYALSQTLRIIGR